MLCGSRARCLGDLLRDPIFLILLAAVTALVVMALDPEPAPMWTVLLEGGAAAVALSYLSLSRAWRHREAERGRLGAAMVEAEPGPRVVTAADGSILFANTAATRFLGKLSPLLWLESGAGTDTRASDAIERLRAATLSRVFENVELPLALDPFEPEWYSVTIRPLRVPGLRPGAIFWSLENITARHTIEEVFHRDHDDLTDFFDFAPVGLFTADAEGRLRTVNHRLAEWLGYEPEQLKGRMFVETLAALPNAQVADEGRGEITFKTSSGSSFEAFVCHAAFDDAGETCTRSVVVRDIMPEREWEQALRDSEHRFRWLFDEAPVGLVLCDLEGLVTACNRTFADMVGQTQGLLIGQPLADRIARQDRDELTNALSKVVMGTAPAAHLELCLNTTRERVAGLFISPMSEEDGEVSGLVLHFIETTEQRSLEIQFAQAQKMQAMGQLAGGVAHDFNNLLTAMIGFCDLLLQRHRAGDPSFADIMQIKQNANRAANLVRQLLAFSRRQPLKPHMLDVSEVLAELSYLLRRLLGETIDLKLVHGRDVGVVRVDPGQLDQVIINLAVNARDAMPGGGLLTIRTGVATFDTPTQRGVDYIPPGDYVTIEVADTGCGISRENVGRIFEPFFTTKQGAAGTGLGLSTVYGIVRQTEGFIQVDSAADEGTIFTIYLPRYSAEDAASIEDPVFGHQGRRTNPAVFEVVRTETAGATPDLTGAGTVLLVEDEEAVRTFAARALRNKGYTVIEAGTGEAAIDTVRKGGSIDILISDVVMPGMDGATLARMVREENPNIRLILMSGYSDDLTREAVNDIPEIHFLAKPFSLERLAGTVKAVMSETPAPARVGDAQN
ncbi:MAG: PAS domain-containing protein [Alphaproteobacteria bacterium]|nr:PAS domain-containing protein [Alphaproteobacteria bacterium]